MKDHEVLPHMPVFYVAHPVDRSSFADLAIVHSGKPVCADEKNARLYECSTLNANKRILLKADEMFLRESDAEASAQKEEIKEVKKKKHEKH